MHNHWEKPGFAEVDLRGECTAYAGGAREEGTAGITLAGGPAAAPSAHGDVYAAPEVRPAAPRGCL
jgi:hypothetical protein